jgi:predicted acyltransferase
VKTPPEAPRLVSLDALRGFDLMWIAGADALDAALRNLDGGPVGQFFAVQLDHAKWAGFHFYDLIFPLFIFLLGAAIPFSLGRLVETEGRAEALRRVGRRALLMYGLGLFYYGGLSTPFEQIRLLGVLQRLALCYFFAGVLFIYLKPRALVAVVVALLAGYWALLTFVPVPGFGPGDLAETHNLSDWIDAHWLPGRKWRGDHDPEGLLSTLPAIASCLFGVFAGLLLRDPLRTEKRKAALLAGAGAGLLALGYLWSWEFPLIKRIWTSSFALVAGGWSALLLAAFYLVIDGWKVRAWAMPFVWIGTNALTIYLLGNLVDFKNLARRFVGGDVGLLCDALRPGLAGLVAALTGIALCFVVARFLWQRKIFLRL